MNIEKIAIFGGSGMTGLCVVEEALSLGFKLKLLLRDPTRFPSELLQKVEIVVGNVLNEEHVDSCLETCQAVIVTLGTGKDLSATTDMSTGLRNIITSMKKQNLSNISVCLSSFLFWEISKVPVLFHEITADHQRMLDLLESSNLDYVAVLPPHIDPNKSKSGYDVTVDKAPQSRVVSTRDLSLFLIECLRKPEYFRKKIGISSA